MAVMYPPEIASGTTSIAERRLFQRIGSDVGNDWTVLHSLNIADNRDKVWGEIDFVLIGPGGIYCLEVKGGRVARRDGVWEFTNRYGQTNRSREGPFAQVQSASHSLRLHLHDHMNWIDETAVGWGVVMPDITFDISDPDIESRVLYDHRDSGRSFGSYLRRLIDFWHEKLEQRRSRPVQSLTGPQIVAIRECLRGDFDLRPSLHTRIGHVSAEMLRLTEEQYRVLDGLAANERVIVRGGAGTGKTLLAVQEARRLAHAGQRVFFACFNRHLAAHLRTLLADVPGVDVYHLHGYMAETVAAAELEFRLPPAEAADLYTVFYPELTVEALLELKLVEQYNALIIDEAQDLLLETYLELFDALIKGGISNGIWRIFLDHNQNIFRSTAVPALQKLAETRPADFRLTINCRNTRPIAVVNSLISGVTGEETLQVDGPEVEQIWYRDRAHQRREISRCLNRLFGEGFSPADIVILSPYRLANGCLADGLENVAYPLYDLSSRTAPPAVSHIRYASVASFKGLESDIVLFIDNDDLTRPNRLATFYVGASRARAYLALFLHEGRRMDYENCAEAYGRRLADLHHDTRENRSSRKALAQPTREL
jgi:hypothetical protein